jgi:hypothetical protein
LQELLGPIGGYGWQQKPKRKQLQSALWSFASQHFVLSFVCIKKVDIMFGCKKNSPTHFVTLLQRVSIICINI